MNHVATVGQTSQYSCYAIFYIIDNVFRASSLVIDLSQWPLKLSRRQVEIDPDLCGRVLSNEISNWLGFAKNIQYLNKEIFTYE